MKVINVKDISKTYEYYKKQEGIKGSLKNLIHKEILSKEAVRNLSFSIEKGDMVGFIGMNGAGKTTTLKMLSGILKPTSGEVDVLGYNPFDKKNDFLKRISMVMGSRSQLWLDIPAIEAFALNKEIYGIEEKQYKDTLDELVELLNVGQLINTQVRRLSLGERMKMELILSLLHSPEIIFLDEPTIGLDVVSQNVIRKMLKAYNQKHNITIILTSHNLDDIETVCSKLMIIDSGQMMFNGELEDFIQKQTSTKILRIKCSRDPARIKAVMGEHKVEILSEDSERMNVKVSKESVMQLTNILMSECMNDIKDISIEEADMQEIICNLYI